MASSKVPEEYLLPAEISVHYAEEVVSSLSAYLKEAQEAVLNGSAIERVDGCGLQLLLAAFKEAGVKGKPCVLIQPSNYLTKVLQITGADKVVSLDWGGWENELDIRSG